MYILIILTVIVCALLGLIVLIQNPKGGGLSSNFSSSSQLMGVQKTGDFLEKGTWVLAITVMVLALAINVVAKGGSASTVNPLQNQIDKASKPSSTAPATTPLNVPAAPAPNKTK
ncbi:preprotein translocase subunit SecG [Mucilaginibacter sp. KACC 22773]|jgi:preprotein translocase subunit SecG|uniref:preprotein translocase subunit SecG n=1 Tax=Mucilaginibacter sp. KACC 22773 TaxID=3025671 RepID=UPI0023665823|nr:preprotein translocase subunit SecG [Mucilaginibacter sp. KACC 22773]WDF76972.1 preprotein translocase subunit SecG [Mucilaginibacter sp. KACC 22773]